MERGPTRLSSVCVLSCCSGMWTLLLRLAKFSSPTSHPVHSCPKGMDVNGGDRLGFSLKTKGTIKY